MLLYILRLLRRQDIRKDTATQCNTLHHTATHILLLLRRQENIQDTATHCSTLQHTATHCNARSAVATSAGCVAAYVKAAAARAAVHCSVLQRVAV